MPLPGKINSFTANTFIVIPGGPVTLSWSTSYSSSVSINNGTVSTSGSKVYNPTSTTTYTLRAYSEAGGESRSLTVIVSGAAPPPSPPPPTPPPSPPSVICTPGALKCIGRDLYVCNTSGTAWTLKQANSPTCAAEGSTPDFWTDPVGWVIGTITKAWEAMLGFVSGQFNIFLNNLKTWQNNFAAQLAVFIQDPLKSLRSWLDGIYAGISAIAGEVTKGISSWWTSMSSTVSKWISDASSSVTRWVNDQLGILQRGWDSTFATIPGIINNAIKGLSAWIDSGFKNIGDWWDSASAGLWDAVNNAWRDFSGWIGQQWDNLGSWWNDQVKILQRGWDNVTTGIRNWFDDQIGILQRGWDSTFATIPDLINTTVIGLKAYIFDVVPGIVEGVIMGLLESIPGLRTVIDFIGGLYDMLRGEYPKHQNIEDAEKSLQDKHKEIKDILDRWRR